MKATALLLCIILVSNPLIFAAKGPEIVQLGDPSMMRLPDGQLDGASASFAKGLLTIQIPFLTGIATWDELAITLIGLQFLQTARNQNQIGWMTYCDPSGNILWAGPITAFDAFLWHWIHTFMPLREGSIASFLPLLTLVSPTLLVLTQLRQNLGSQLPPGILSIVFYGAILQATGAERGVEIRTTTASQSLTKRILMTTPSRQFLNYIAYGLAGPYLVTQLLLITNLTNRTCNVDLLLYNYHGGFVASLVLTVLAFQSIRANLGLTAGSLMSETQAVPEFFFGTGRVLTHPQCDLDLATIYRIEDTQVGPGALSATPAQNESLLGEAGLAISSPSNLNMVAVLRNSEEGTGLAIGNPDLSETASLSMSLIDSDGTVVASVEDIEIGPLAVSAAFFWEYFEGIEIPAVFDGTLMIVSDVGIQTTALNTMNGFIQSSLPSSQPGP